MGLAALGTLLRSAAVAKHRSGVADRNRLLYCSLELSAWDARFQEGQPGGVKEASSV